MKKVLLPLFSLLLVFTLLLSVTGTAKAVASVPEGLPDPTVTPVSGDMDFTVEIIPIVNLPGVTELANQMLVPVGFPAGEAQFGGNGIRVSKMDSGKATVCFSLSTIAVQQGWGGKVGVWNGTKWVKLATSITTGTDEAAATLACANITGNGTYAFIKYVADTKLLPTSKPLCEDLLGNEIWWSGFLVDEDPITFTGPRGVDVSLPWPGVLISWQVINSNYPMGGVTSGSQVIDEDGFFDFGSSQFWWLGPDSEYPIFTIRLDTPFCYQEDLQIIDWVLPD